MKKEPRYKRKIEVLKIEIYSILYHIPRMLPGYYFSNKIRGLFLKLFLKKIGKNTYIGRDIVFEIPGNISIGDNVQINTRCWFSGGGGLEIGNNTLIGPHVVIHSANHNFSSLKEPIINQGHTFKKVIIENDVWIGANATILPGVTVKKGCVIAAGAVVTKDTEVYGVYGGVPARLLKKRGELDNKDL